jgi:hypothetical protein
VSFVEGFSTSFQKLINTASRLAFVVKKIGAPAWNHQHVDLFVLGHRQ